MASSESTGAQRSTVLLVHDDGDLLDVLTRLFEQDGCSVSIAPTGFFAINRLSDEDPDVIVAGWRGGGGLGQELYDWVLANKYHLRSQFVFVGTDTSGTFETLAQGRCLLLPTHELDEIQRVAEACMRRSHALRASSLSDEELEWFDAGRNTLLVVDDDPMLLSMMVRLLNDIGFEVTPAESGNHAISRLADTRFDVLLVDWYMPDGSGAALYEWILAERPELAERCVFMSAASPEDFERLAPGRLLIPKGQDSPRLIQALLAAARD